MPESLPRSVVDLSVPQPQQQKTGPRQLPHFPVFMAPEYSPTSRTLPKPPTKPLSSPNVHPKNRPSVFIGDFQPPSEEVYERDLDESVTGASSGGTSPTPAADKLVLASGGLKRKSPVRVVTSGHGRKLWESKVEEITAKLAEDPSLVLSVLAESPSEPKRAFHQKQSR